MSTLSLNDIKPLGAFVENTLRPLLDKAGDILFEFQRQGINITEENIVRYTKEVAKAHMVTVVIQAIRDIIIASIIAGVLWTIYQS